MKKKPYSKVGKTYYPRPQKPVSSDTEFHGAYSRAWIEDGQYYFEYDSGHFQTKFEKVQISEDEFRELQEEKISPIELARKYEKT